MVLVIERRVVGREGVSGLWHGGMVILLLVLGDCDTVVGRYKSGDVNPVL